MALPCLILTGLIALLHAYIAWLEMFAWTTRAPKIFKQIPKELFPPTRVLAANQGLYNGFLAAGLTWSLFIHDKLWSANIATFFLACVAIAGIFGAITASRRIFFIQAFPALVTLVLMVLL